MRQHFFPYLFVSVIFFTAGFLLHLLLVKPFTNNPFPPPSQRWIEVVPSTFSSSGVWKLPVEGGYLYFIENRSNVVYVRAAGCE